MKKILILLLFFPLASFAFIPFGGPILNIVPCCNGLMLTINKYYRYWPGLPPTLIEPGTYLFQWGLSNLIVGFLMPGQQSLGMSIPGGVCLTTTNPFVPCSTPIPTMYTILFVGTSMPISF